MDRRSRSIAPVSQSAKKIHEELSSLIGSSTDEDGSDGGKTEKGDDDDDGEQTA